MKTLIKFFVSLILLVVVLLSATSQSRAEVTITINQTSFTYAHSPRLSEVLSPVALQQPWYWPATKLYRLESTDIEQQRQQLLMLIAQLKQQAPLTLKADLTLLQQQVSSWQLGQRIAIPIDYDLARAQLSFNRRFEAGQYKMQLVERPKTVVFWGAVEHNVNVEHLGGTAISAYLAAVPRTAFADMSLAIIIQPDGTLVPTGVAAWNHQFAEAMPGATVFIPFSAAWFNSDMARLNTMLVALAIHRIEQ